MKQIKFKSVRFRNFQSYGNEFTTFVFKDSGTVLIVGEDLDNTSDGISSNGTGKSTILNALTYGVYDKPISKVTQDGLVNNINNKQMEVEVEYIGNDGENYKIHRFRKMKAGAGGNDVHFYKNGTNITLDSVARTNALIEQTIGMPYDLFVRIIVYSATRTPFLSLKPLEQKEVLEELFGTTDISRKAEVLKRHIKEGEHKLEMIQVKHTSQESERIRLANQIETTKQRILDWDVKQSAQISDLKVQIAEIANIDIEEQIELHRLFTKGSTALETHKQEGRMCAQTLAALESKLTKKRQELSHLVNDKCPYCLQSLSDTTTKITNCEKDITNIEEGIATLQTDIANNQQIVNKLTDKLTAISSLITIQSLKELTHLRDISLTAHQRLRDLREAKNPFIAQLDDLQQVSLPPIDYTDVNTITNVLHHQRFLLKLLTRKDSFIRKALLQKNLPYLNKKLQEYLKLLKLPHKVTFTKEMEATIHQMGKSLSFGNLSQGQAARVNFALSLAFRDVLQNLHPTINVCMLDEVLDFGLDSIGVIAAAKLVKHKAREDGICIYIISHRDEVSSIFEEKLIVRLHKGFSSIHST